MGCCHAVVIRAAEINANQSAVSLVAGTGSGVSQRFNSKYVFLALTADVD